MTDFTSLKILDLFRPLFNKIGVDYPKMRLILSTKLLLDSRKGENGKNPYNKTLIFYLIVGILCSRIVLMQIDLMPKLMMIFAFLSVMLLTCFISDFSSAILDISDKYVIGVTDVDSKTLSVTKIVYIFIYILGISAAISLCSMVMFLLVYNSMRFCLLFILSMILIDFLLIMLTSICYYVLIKLFNGDRLKDVLNVFQLIMLGAFLIVYYSVSMGIDIETMGIVYEPNILSVFIPFSWFAALFYVAFGINREIIYIVLSILAIVVPIISMYVYLKLTPVFEANLEKLELSFYTKPKKKKKLLISEILCKDLQERAFFDFISTNSSRDKDFKTKLYYNSMLSILMPIVVLFAGYSGDFFGHINSLKDSNLFFYIYLIGVTFQTNLFLFSYSNDFEASFIYDVMPIDNYNKIYKAELKVVIAKLLTPMMAIIGLVYLYVFKLDVLKHLVVVFLSLIITVIFTFKINDKKLPFSEDYVVTSNTSNFLKSLKSCAFVALFGILHYGVIKYLSPVFIYAYILILAAILVLTWKILFKDR